MRKHAVRIRVKFSATNSPKVIPGRVLKFETTLVPSFTLSCANLNERDVIKWVPVRSMYRLLRFSTKKKKKKKKYGKRIAVFALL